MTREEFNKLIETNYRIESGSASMPTSNALIILIHHFLGEDWTSNLIHTGQVNVEDVYEIICKYPQKRDKKKMRLEKLIGFLDKIKDTLDKIV